MARTGNDTLQLWSVVGTGRNVFNLADDEHAVLTNHLAKHDVLLVEEGRRLARDEELAPVRVRTRVGLLCGGGMCFGRVGAKVRAEGRGVGAAGQEA